MNCQEALSLLYDIIDGEASEIDVKRVQRHRDRCKHCFEIYRVESAIQEFINEKVKDGNPDVSLETLKAKISNKLDEIDSGQATRWCHFSFKRAAALLAAAASVIILIGGGLILRDYYRHQTEYVPLERAHIAIMDDPVALENNASAFSAILRVRGELGYDIWPNVSGFSLRGGWNEEVMGVKMAHFVYCNDHKIVSVFVAPSEQFAIPDDLKDSKVVRNQISFYDHDCPECRLVYYRAGSAIIITATTDHTIELLDFVPGCPLTHTKGQSQV